MQIVLVSTYAQSCGLATYSEALRKALQELGHSVSVLAEVPLPASLRGAMAGIPDIPGVYRVWQRGHAYQAQHGLGAIVKAIKSSKTKPDVVHFQHEFGLFQDSGDFHRALQELAAITRVVVTLHTVLLPPRQKTFFSNWPVGTSVVVHDGAQIASLQAWQQPITTHIIPHGTTIRTKTSWHRHQTGPLKVLCPGFVSRSKAHGSMIAAVAETDHLLTIAGECRDDRYMTELNNYIRDFGVENQVKILDAFHSDQQMDDLFCDSDYVVLGSNFQVGKNDTPLFSVSGQVATARGYGIPIIAKNAPIYRSPGVLLYDDNHQCTTYMKAMEQHNTRVMLGALVSHNRTDWATVAAQHLAVYT